MIRILASAMLAAAIAQGAAKSGERAAALKEANASFTYQGKPINPLLVQELLTTMADANPGPVAVGLDHSDSSNRNFGEWKRIDEGWVAIELKTTKVPPDPEERGWFHYKRIGTLANGLHVLETASNGGGSGIFMDLLLVRIVSDTEYGDDGALQPRLVMQRAGEISLGDRYSGTVTVRPNEIEIGAERDGSRKRRLLKFP